MLTLNTTSLVVFVWLFGSSVDAGEAPGVRLKKLADVSAYTKKLDADRLTVWGKEWEATLYCNEETASNPSELEAFAISGSTFELAILCPGTVDGDENTVSVFSRTQPPRTERVKPLCS